MLSWNQLRLLPIDDNPQRMTELENYIQSKENLLSGEGLDQPVVEISTKSNAGTVKKSRNRSHDPCENLRSRGEATAKNF